MELTMISYVVRLKLLWNTPVSLTIWKRKVCRMYLFELSLTNHQEGKLAFSELVIENSIDSYQYHLL
jgi:hypothetical protein